MIWEVFFLPKVTKSHDNCLRLCFPHRQDDDDEDEEGGEENEDGDDGDDDDDE